jgi:hypothetical protein
MLAHALSTWPHLQAYMRQDIEDTLLAEQLIDAATLAIEGYCRATFVQRTITAEQCSAGLSGQRGGVKRLYLRYYPIASVTSIVDDQTTPATVVAADYTILGDLGALEYNDTYWPLPIYRWKVTYVAGMFASMDAVTDDLRLACNMQAADWYRNQPTSVVSESKGDNSKSYAINHTELLPQVQALVKRYRTVDV